MAAIVFGVLTGLVSVVPGYRALRSWRANDLASKAAESLEAGDVQRASELAVASLQLEGHSAENRRLFAEHFEESDPEGALLHSHMLISHPEATPKDLYRYVAQCLDRDFAADSADALNRLLEMAPRDPANWVLAGEYERARGNYQEALTFVDRALALQSEFPMAQWLGATLATESSDLKMRAAGHQRLWSLAKRRDFVGLRALSQLAVGDFSEEHEVDALIEKLTAHPMASMAHRLAGEHLRLRQANSSTMVEGLVRVVEQRYGHENRALFLSWLNRVGEFEGVIQRVSFEEAQQERELFLTLAEAMLEGGKARELMTVLTSEETTLPIRESTREFLVIEVARKLNLNDRAEKYRGTLIKRAETINPPVSVLSLAQRFETKQLWRDAERAYLHLIEAFPGEKGRVYDRLTRCYRQLGDLAGLLALSEYFSELEPDNPIYAHNWAYLTLLRGDSSDEAMRVLERLFRDFGITSSACVRALQMAYHGDTTAALALVEPFVWESLAPLDQRMVRAVLTLSGESVPRALLKPLSLTLFEEEEAWIGRSARLAIEEEAGHRELED